jgi:hypothetical protein
MTVNERVWLAASNLRQAQDSSEAGVLAERRLLFHPADFEFATRLGHFSPAERGIGRVFTDPWLTKDWQA